MGQKFIYGLFDGDRGLREITLKEVEENERIALGIERINGRTFKKMIKTVDEALVDLNPSKSSQLTWTQCGALLGYNSNAPTASTNHLWEKAYDAFYHVTKHSNIFVGCLLRWRINLLAHQNKDVWLTMKQVTESIDPDTGKIITRACYWINNSPKLQKNLKTSKPKIDKKAPATLADCDALANRFGNKGVRL